MTDIIIASLVAAAASILGNYLLFNKNQAVLEERINELKEDITILSDRVEQHNKHAIRLALIEQRLDNIERGLSNEGKI